MASTNIVIIGDVNSGKTSLLKAMAGYKCPLVESNPYSFSYSRPCQCTVKINGVKVKVNLNDSYEKVIHIALKQSAQ